MGWGSDVLITLHGVNKGLMPRLMVPWPLDQSEARMGRADQSEAGLVSGVIVSGSAFTSSSPAILRNKNNWDERRGDREQELTFLVNTYNFFYLITFYISFYSRKSGVKKQNILLPFENNSS